MSTGSRSCVRGTGAGWLIAVGALWLVVGVAAGCQSAAATQDAGPADAVGESPSFEVLPESQCGNERVEAEEGCDDGNIVSGDGCSDSCQIECPWTGICPSPKGSTSPCGDGVLATGEACDDGNMVPADGCTSICQLEPGWTCLVPGKRCVPTCGDKLIVGPETCDDGNELSGDGCSAACTAEEHCFDTAGKVITCPRLCGDGALEGNEACDNGPGNGDGVYGGCTSDCRFGPFCGDGATTAPEECDLGAQNRANYSLAPSDGCSFGCQRTRFCGDGHVDTNFGERCDMGVNNGKSAAESGGNQRCDVACQPVVGG